MISNVMKFRNIKNSCNDGWSRTTTSAKFPVCLLHRIDAAAIWYGFYSEQPLRLSTFFLRSAHLLPMRLSVKIMDRGTIGMCSYNQMFSSRCSANPAKAFTKIPPIIGFTF